MAAHLMHETLLRRSYCHASRRQIIEQCADGIRSLPLRRPAEIYIISHISVLMISHRPFQIQSWSEFAAGRALRVSLTVRGGIFGAGILYAGFLSSGKLRRSNTARRFWLTRAKQYLPRKSDERVPVLGK